MKTIKLILLLWIGLFFSLFTFALENEKTNKIDMYDDTYHIDYKGVKAGKLKLNSWIDQKNKSYRLKAQIKPTLLARALGIKKMTGISLGEIVDDLFILNTNEWTNTKNKKLLTIKIKNNKAKVNKNGRLEEYTVANGAQEPLAMVAYLSWSLKHDKLPQKVHLIVKKGQQSYLVTKEGDYQLKLTETPNGRRVIMLNYDENYQLKSLVRTKKGKVDFRVWR